MGGILAESKDLLKQAEATDPQLLTLALVGAAQDVEGHEITGYACAHNYARLLGYGEDLKPLEETFQEEKRMEESLLTVAERLGAEEKESEVEVEPAPAAQG